MSKRKGLYWLSLGVAAVLLSVMVFKTAEAYEVENLTDEEGRIYLTDREGNLWRCFLDERTTLPLQCHPEESETDKHTDPGTGKKSIYFPESQ